MDFETNYEDEGDKTGMVCMICGSNQFTSQEGFYYCIECNTQSQQIREYIDDAHRQGERGGSAGVAVLGKERPKKKKAEPKPKILLSSWEVYNLLLRGMTDKLISIGFPDLLRDKVFQLWKTYLRKRKVILCENDQNPLKSASRITIREPQANLMAFYKYRKAIKRKYKCKSKFTVDSYVARKKADNKLRRKAFETTYLASQDDDDLPPGVERVKKETKVGLRQLKLTPTATKFFRAMKHPKRKLKSKHRFLDSSIRTSKVLEHECFSYSKVLILLFIAARQIGCRVVFTDFIRLFNEGTLYVNSLQSLMGYEEGSRHAATGNGFLASKLLATSNPVHLAASVQGLLDFLGVHKFQYPQFQEFLPKFVRDSSLPLEFESLLSQLYKMYPADDHLLDLRHEHCPLKLMIELLITSMIGLLLRMLFGLDDLTEKHQSLFAFTVNKILSRHLDVEENGDPRGEWTQLFDIKEWFRHIRYRTSFVEQEGLTPIKFRHGKPPNLIRLNDITTRYSTPGIEAPLVETIIPDPETRTEEPQPLNPEEMTGGEARNDAAVSALKGIFQLASTKEHGSDIPNVSDYVSLPYPNQSMVQEFKHGKPNICYPNYDSSLLYADFGKRRIDFILNPAKYIPLLEKAGYRVQVMPGTVPQYAKTMKVKRRRLFLFQPYKKFEDSPETHAQISASMQFVLDHLSRYIYACENYEESLRWKPHVLVLIQKLTQLYTLRSLNGFVPLVS